MRHPQRAFTLVEMMVVLTVSLLMMTMIVPIFKVSTRTVQTVERKLAVYEAARNIIEIIESDVQLAMSNEKGDHFSIKHVSWLDTDPFTPPSPTPPLTPGVSDTSSLAYRQSRRVTDALDYIRIEGNGVRGGPDQFPGGKAFPMAYPDHNLAYPEAWKCSLRSTLLYQHPVAYASSDYQLSASGQRWNRNEQLADVGQIEAALVFYSSFDQPKWYAGALNYAQHYDQAPQFMGPGREIRVPISLDAVGDQGGVVQRRLGGLKIMDLSIAYWDDSPANAGGGGGKQFKDLPDNTVVYFWPAPKAIRITITVCDVDKRDQVTLCRVVQIPLGCGGGVINTAAMDTAYYSAALGGNTPAVFNRTKYLPQLPAAFNGNASVADGTDFSKSNETLTILSDGVKPVNWP